MTKKMIMMNLRLNDKERVDADSFRRYEIDFWVGRIPRDLKIFIFKSKLPNFNLFYKPGCVFAMVI